MNQKPPSSSTPSRRPQRASDPSHARDFSNTCAANASTSETAPRRPGRPSNCTPETVGMLRGLIRELGLSDSAAAERMGIGVSTLSRWKREDPEVRLFLRQAREECRALHLMQIIQTSQAANGKGWRASAWLLERLFPEDYAPSATQREKFRALAERRREAEERESEEAELEELMAAAQEAAQNGSSSGEATETPAAHVAESAQHAEIHSSTDAHNCRNAPGGLAEGNSGFADIPENDAHNCRISPASAEGRWAVSPGPALQNELGADRKPN